MNMRKVITVMKSAATYFGVGTAIAGAAFTVILVVVHGFPVILVATATLACGLIAAGFFAAYDAWKFDRNLSERATEEHWRQDQALFHEKEQKHLEELHQGLQTLKALKLEQIELQKKEIEQLKLHGVQIVIPEGGEHKKERCVSEFQLNNKIVFFRPAINDAQFTQKKESSVLHP